MHVKALAREVPEFDVARVAVVVRGDTAMALFVEASVVENTEELLEGTLTSPPIGLLTL